MIYVFLLFQFISSFVATNQCNVLLIQTLIGGEDGFGLGSYQSSLSSLSTYQYATRNEMEYRLISFPIEWFRIRNHDTSWSGIYALKEILFSEQYNNIDYFLLVESKFFFLTMGNISNFIKEAADLFLWKAPNTNEIDHGFQIWKNSENLFQIIENWLNKHQESFALESTESTVSIMKNLQNHLEQSDLRVSFIDQSLITTLEAFPYDLKHRSDTLQPFSDLLKNQLIETGNYLVNYKHTIYYYPHQKNAFDFVINNLSPVYHIRSNFVYPHNISQIFTLAFTILLEESNYDALIDTVSKVCVEFEVPQEECNKRLNLMFQKIEDKKDFLLKYENLAMEGVQLPLPSNNFRNGRNHLKFLIVQGITDGYDIYPHEWDLKEYPHSLIALSHLSAYFYARRHGYDYVRVIVPDEFMFLVDHHGAWAKNYALEQVLQSPNVKDYDYIVIIDSDAVFMQPEIKLETKMQEWTVDFPNWRSVDVFAPNDTEASVGLVYPFDGLHRNINTGFQIWKNSPLLKVINDEWIRCAEIIDEECEFWNQKWGFDQGAFNYMKYYFQQHYQLQLQIIPCSEANGFPSYISNYHVEEGEKGNQNCSGEFVSHFWQNSKMNAVKPILPKIIQDIIEIYDQEIHNFSSDYYFPFSFGMEVIQDLLTHITDIVDIDIPITNEGSNANKLHLELSSENYHQDILYAEIQDHCQVNAINGESCVELFQLIVQKLKRKKEFLDDYFNEASIVLPVSSF